MKSSTLNTFSSLVKGILRGKRKQAVAMETYLGCIPTIQTLVDKHLLGINLKERIVVIDVSVHLMYVSTKAGKSMDEADRRYSAFMDKVVAFMNFQLGRMGARDFIDPKKEPIHFLVTMKETVMWENGEPVPAHLQVREKKLFVGLYKDGKINYREYGGNEIGQM